MRVILAEDGDDHARIIKTILQRNQIEVIHFKEGRSAYEYIKSNRDVKLLITDIMMPGMSGFELINLLKSESILPPTIVLISRQRDEDILEGLKLGVIDYITKPFSPSIVLAKIKNALLRVA